MRKLKKLMQELNDIEVELHRIRDDLEVDLRHLQLRLASTITELEKNGK